jgi:hypothetical protein
LAVSPTTDGISYALCVARSGIIATRFKYLAPGLHRRISP